MAVGLDNTAGADHRRDEGADLHAVAPGGAAEDAENDLPQVAGWAQQKTAVKCPAGDLDQGISRDET